MRCHRFPLFVVLAAVVVVVAVVVGVVVAFDRGWIGEADVDVGMPPAGAPILAGAQDVGSEVGMYRGTAARTGEQPGPAPEGERVLIWQADLSGRPKPCTPVVGSGMVFAV